MDDPLFDSSFACEKFDVIASYSIKEHQRFVVGKHKIK